MSQAQAAAAAVGLTKEPKDNKVPNRRDLIAAAVLSQLCRALVPEKAAKQAVEFTDALLKELDK